MKMSSSTIRFVGALTALIALSHIWNLSYQNYEAFSDDKPILNRKHSRGIVMCASDDIYMLTGVKYALKSIRTNFNVTIPVTIAHCDELSHNLQAELTSSYEDVAVVDLCGGKTPYSVKKRLRG